MKIYLAIFALIFFTGCGMKINEYSASSQNVKSLKKVLTNKISVLPFSSIEPNKNYVLCRVADTISTPNNESFEKYIENAFKEELKMSDLYDSQSSIKISGHLKKVISLSMPGNTYWEINVDIKSNNGKSFSVSTKYEYAATFMAYTACNNMANTFAPTIKLLINKIITHPEFIILVEDNRQST